MNIKSHHVGLVVELRFWDHAIGSSAALIEIVARGKILKVTAKEIILEHWSILTLDKTLEADNREQAAIAQKTLISATFFSPKKALKFY